MLSLGKYVECLCAGIGPWQDELGRVNEYGDLLRYSTLPENF